MMFGLAGNWTAALVALCLIALTITAAGVQEEDEHEQSS